MTLHEKQMELVDAVNNAKTTHEHSVAYWQLMGWREGVRACGREPDLISCDLTQFDRGHEDRPMCCGVFNDWSESPNAKLCSPALPESSCSALLDGWRDGLYPFGEMKEGESCRVQLENGMEMEAGCFKHHPCGDHPELWEDDWITNDPRCQDKKNGRLYGEQSVAMWKPSNEEAQAQPPTATPERKESEL